MRGKIRVDVADVVETVREAMDTLATSSQGAGDVASTLLDKWFKIFSASCEASKASHAQQSLGVPPPSANMSSLALQHPKDFSNGCQLRALDWSGGEAQERGLAHVCTRSRD